MNSVSKSLDSAIHSLARVSMTFVFVVTARRFDLPARFHRNNPPLVEYERAQSVEGDEKKALFADVDETAGQNTIALKVNSTNRSTKLNKINAKSRKNLKCISSSRKDDSSSRIFIIIF